MPDEVDIQYLYKYRSLSGKSSSYVERLLVNNELYFPRPREFNDPFDCCPVLSLEATDDELRRYFFDLHKRRMPELSRTDRRRSLAAVRKNLSRNHKSKETFDFMSKAMDEAVNSVAVCSLSAKEDHILMWSHYADSHQGICLRFQASSITPFFGRAQRVHYQAARPALNPIHDDPYSQSEKALLTKADFWSYEEEWRIVEHEAGPGIHRFPAALLDGLILGARISAEDKRKVLNWVAKRKTSIEVRQAQIDTAQFRLEIIGAGSP